MILKYHHTDKGFCRVCFTTQGIVDPKNEYYYCLQEDGNQVKMYRCSNTSQDAPWEPEYPVTFTGPVDILLPAVGDYSEYTDSLISRWERNVNMKEYNMTEQQEYYTFTKDVKTLIQVPEHPTINVCGVELPMPETAEPVLWTKYWLSPACTEMIWGGYQYNKSGLKEGRVHLTKDNAKAWADWWKKEVIAKINEIGS